jgi:transcription elongation factor Elf1
MQRQFNVFVPFACPRCDVEMIVTLEELHDGATVRCVSCGARVDLAPEEFTAAHPAQTTDDTPMRFQM